MKKLKYYPIILLEVAMILIFLGSYLYKSHHSVETYFENQEDYIKWVDFNVSYEAL